MPYYVLFFFISITKPDLVFKEDEEQWISGEELYTDGSSDEEGKRGAHRKHKRDHKGARPKEKPLLQHSDALPKPALVVASSPDSDTEDPPIDISWKPKRGSIKLPHMTKDLETAQCSTSQSAEPIVE